MCHLERIWCHLIYEQRFNRETPDKWSSFWIALERGWILNCAIVCAATTFRFLIWHRLCFKHKASPRKHWALFLFAQVLLTPSMKGETYKKPRKIRNNFHWNTMIKLLWNHSGNSCFYGVKSKSFQAYEYSLRWIMVINYDE